MLNYDQITGIVRAVAPALVTWMVGIGWTWANTSWGGLIVIAVVTAGACVWSYINNKTGKIIGGSGAASVISSDWTLVLLWYAIIAGWIAICWFFDPLGLGNRPPP